MITTEFVLLLSFVALLMFATIFGDAGPQATFEKSAPRLAARLEKNLETGAGWIPANGKSARWLVPSGGIPGN